MKKKTKDQNVSDLVQKCEILKRTILTILSLSYPLAIEYLLVYKCTTIMYFSF